MANEEHLAILKQGVKAWNKWREKNPETCDKCRRNTLKVELQESHNRWAHYNLQVFKESRMHRNTIVGLNTVQPPKRHQEYLLIVPLMLALLLAGCANSTVDRESAIQGRWHRISGPNAGDVGDPFFSLAGEYFEFRPHGVVVRLLFDRGPQLFWTARTGEYLVSDTDQVTIKGKCWQGWQSYDCSQTYHFDLKGDSLTIFDTKSDERHVEYERIGSVSSDLPPTLIPPMPSATPLGE